MTVQKGAPVGAIVNDVGDVTETFTAPFAATVVTATRRPNMAVYPGDEVLSLMNLG